VFWAQAYASETDALSAPASYTNNAKYATQHIKVMGRGSSYCDPWPMWPIQNCDPFDPWPIACSGRH